MEISRVIVKNFRSIKEADISLGNTTVFIGPNNAGKTSILDAIRIALTRRWGQRGTGFTEQDIHLQRGITDPRAAPPISVQIELQEEKEGAWPIDLHNALDDIIQVNPITGRGIIILNVTCGFTGTPPVFEPRWGFLNIDRQPLTGRAARSVNLQEFFQYVPVFYLDSLRDADDEFSSRSQFWGRLLKAMNIPDALKATLKARLDELNTEVLAADPRLATVATSLKTIAKISPNDAPGELELRATPLQAWDMLAKTEVIYKAQPDQPWLRLTDHGQGTQSLAVIFLFDAFVKLLLPTTFAPDSTPILELEEPETHLHPQATKSLCATILQLSGQKLVTTHSPYFVQSVPFRDLRILRMTEQGTQVSWLPPTVTTPLPPLPKLDAIIQQHDTILSYDATTTTLTIKAPIDDTLYRCLLKAYAGHTDLAAITTSLKQAKAQAALLITDDELAKLETWARRIRGEIFFARKWLIVEGQSDYLVIHTVAQLLGYPLDDNGISIVDAQNSGNPGIFAALARALNIPWIALFDGDNAGKSYLDQVKKRGFDTTEITNRCQILPKNDLEQVLVEDGMEPELRAILARLGEKDALTMSTPDVISALRKNKIEYAIELCDDLKKTPALVTKVPTVIQETINRLRALQQ